MEKMIYVVFIIVSILLIAIVLLQSKKAEGASQALTGGVDLFTERKERGAEKFITRVTFVCGVIFFVLAFILSYVF